MIMSGVPQGHCEELKMHVEPLRWTTIAVRAPSGAVQAWILAGEALDSGRLTLDGVGTTGEYGGPDTADAHALSASGFSMKDPYHR